MIRALTARQVQVLKLLTSGLTNKQIAHQLGISVKTIDAHRANIMITLKARNLADLVRYALRQGIISLDE